MNRATATTYLVGSFGSGANNLLAAADIVPTDTSGGLTEPIDDALLLLGVGVDDLDTTEPTDALAYRACLRYTTLKRILAGLGAKVHMDVEAGDGVSLKGSQLVAKVERLLAVAATEALAVGVVVGSGSGGSWAGIPNTGTPLGWGLDFLEPRGAEYVR